MPALMNRFYHSIWVLSVISLIGCSPRISETGRFPSPSGEIDAITAIRETGATVATPTEVYLLPRGNSVSGEPILRADKVEGLVITWKGDTQIIIHAKTARVFLAQTKAVVVLNSHEQVVSVDLDILQNLD